MKYFQIAFFEFFQIKFEIQQHQNHTGVSRVKKLHQIKKQMLKPNQHHCLVFNSQNIFQIVLQGTSLELLKYW